MGARPLPARPPSSTSPGTTSTTARRSPKLTVALHEASAAWLRGYCDQPGPPTVVVTHHAPSARSIASRHADDPVSAAFASSLDELVGRLGAALWIHGHTHHCVDYRVVATRVISNQRGYQDEETGWIPDLVVEVG